MRLRSLLLAALLVVGFVYLTARNNLLPDRVQDALRSRTGPLFTGPDPSVARSAGLSSDEQNNIDIYRTNRAAAVFITSTVYRQTWFSQVVPQRGSGSGFFISEDGRILTNNHVISGSREIQVTLEDQSRYNATVLRRDPANDLALLQIRPRKRPAFLRLGDSDHVQVGQKVLAIGNPFGLEGTLTVGIISSLGRSIQDEQGRRLEALIQTDAAINPGNSGGPLLDSQGNVIGINTAIYGPGGNIGIGFAMPVNRAKAMLEDFRSGRPSGRPRLGVTVVYVAGDLAEALELPAEGGLLVQEVDPNSAAAAGRLRGARQYVLVGNAEVGVGGDLIMAIDGRAVERNDSLRRALDRKRPGDALELTLFRGGRRVNVSVTLDAVEEQ